MKDFIDRLVRQPVALGVVANAGWLAAFPTASTAWNLFVTAAVGLFVKMYSTSAKNIEDVAEQGYNKAVTELNILDAETKGLAPPPLPPVIQPD